MSRGRVGLCVERHFVQSRAAHAHGKRVSPSAPTNSSRPDLQEHLERNIEFIFCLSGTCAMGLSAILLRPPTGAFSGGGVSCIWHFGKATSGTGRQQFPRLSNSRGLGRGHVARLASQYKLGLELKRYISVIKISACQLGWCSL